MKIEELRRWAKSQLKDPKLERELLKKVDE